MGFFTDAINAITGRFPSLKFSWTWNIAETGYKEMRDVITLIDAICDAYDRNDYKPNSDGTTHCNQAVNSIAMAMGCAEFTGMNADQIVEHIKSSDKWSSVPIEKTQDMANQGSLLVAGLSSQELGESHGHVVIIRPGKTCQSGKWGATPRCVNIGKNDFIARAQSGPLTMMPVGLNDAFIPLPKIWVWRPSI